jgi:hypothetical protein
VESRHAHFVPGFSIHEDGLHRPDTKPVSVAHSGLVLIRRCIPVRSSTVTVVLHGSYYWLLSEDFIVEGLAVPCGWLLGNNEVIQGSILLDAHATDEAPSTERGTAGS